MYANDEIMVKFSPSNQLIIRTIPKCDVLKRVKAKVIGADDFIVLSPYYTSFFSPFSFTLFPNCSLSSLSLLSLSSPSRSLYSIIGKRCCERQAQRWHKQEEMRLLKDAVLLLATHFQVGNILLPFLSFKR
jgi:hypothetical protein